ncbi:alpha/beta hydrolase [Streptomyces sp. Cmuel-A718b]|uniref:alpha/beta fold hydrolase n=1 Tax=Streptomyces sp. Cmuel-A718b TaxID=697328 RepID=UPI00081D95D9|nr:alpha/beta hydrolase [Streptomyces sp. Cmuel-A718b]SCF60604.1 Pimeloyl-ACP methyl ester carboxylesterase [Streptomyces sp. Cmuel-A718b]
MGIDDSTYVHGIHVVHDGPREAPPLVLVHGSGASGSSWGPVVPVLARRHHVIRVDLPGHGQSPPAASYDVPGQAAVLAAALDELALSSVTVAGHSSGGYIATALAERRPDLVEALALISSGPSPEALLPQPAVLRALIAPPLGPLMWRVRSDAMLRRGVTAVCSRPVTVPDDMVDDVRDMSYGTFRTVLRRNAEYIAERSVPTRLGALDVPALVVFGTADPRWDPDAVRLYDGTANTRVERLAGVGHFPMLEAPAETGESLLRFLAAAGRRPF